MSTARRRVLGSPGLVGILVTQCASVASGRMITSRSTSWRRQGTASDLSPTSNADLDAGLRPHAAHRQQTRLLQAPAPAPAAVAMASPYGYSPAAAPPVAPAVASPVAPAVAPPVASAVAPPVASAVGAAPAPAYYPAQFAGAAPAAAPAPGSMAAPWSRPAADLTGDGVISGDDLVARSVLNAYDHNHDGVVNATEVVVEVVSVSFAVENVNYEELVADDSLRTSFVDSIKESIVSSTGNMVTTDDVTVELHSGSVVVDAFITPPANGTSGMLQQSLNMDALSTAVVSSVSAIPGIGSVLTGPLSMTIISLPTKENHSEIDPEVLAAADVNHDGVLSGDELAHVPGPGTSTDGAGLGITLLPEHLAENAFCGPHGRCLGDLLVVANVQKPPNVVDPGMQLQCGLERYTGAPESETKSWLHCNGPVAGSKATCKLPMVNHLKIGDHLKGRCFLASGNGGAKLTEDSWFMVKNDHQDATAGVPGIDIMPFSGAATNGRPRCGQSLALGVIAGFLASSLPAALLA